MKVTLDTPRVINKTAVALELTDFSFDEYRREIHVGYNFIDATNRSSENMVRTIDGQDAQDLLDRADVIAAGLAGGKRVYKALRQAILENLLTIEGETGTIVDG